MPDNALNDYLPVVLLAAFAVGFAALNVVLSWALGKRGKQNRDKDAPFECGMVPFEDVGRHRFPVKFYVVAMLFIIFDIETVFMIPWAVAFRQLSQISGLLIVEMFVFIAILGVGYSYIWKRGALQWD